MKKSKMLDFRLAFFFLCLTMPCAESLLAAMSVDLGSEFIKIGIVKPGVPMEIVLNRESHRKTASIVGIKNAERAFGDPAAQMAIKHPSSSFRYLNDLLGKVVDSSFVRTYKDRFPHHNLVADADRGTVSFQDESGQQYPIEELIAMLLSESRALAEKYAEQPVKDAVVTVPPYFNQAERRAVAAAANIAGLNLLQLINDNTAAGINYGMFRRKEFNESSTVIMIYDMGATKTTASIFEYQLIKDKNGRELNPQMTVLGVGYDRTLGGLELTYRLRDRLADEFMKQGKVKNDVRKNPRAMAKLHKEAERVKQVLSANQDHFAQIENLMEDTDFRVKITRQQFEEMCADVFDRVGTPITDALAMAELSLDQISTVVMMGGGTRVPKVQEKLQSVLGQKELGKYLNTDEAIALGAVYQAAHLSKGFKVKKFTVKEATLFPVTVDFKKEASANADEKVRRTLFSRKNPFPQRKVMTFSKHKHDFAFTVNYGDLKFLNKAQLEQLGSLNISQITLAGLGDSVQAHQDPALEYKGAKVHFLLDDSGILSVINAESVFERAVAEEKEQSTLSKLGNKLSSFFGGGSENEFETHKKEDGGSPEDTTAAPGADSEGSKQQEATKKKGQTESQDGQKPADAADSSTNTTQTNKTIDASKNVTVDDTKSTAKAVRDKLKMEVKCIDIANVTEESLTSSKKRLKTFEEAEELKRAREKAHNALESFLFDTSDRLNTDSDFMAVSSEEERSKIRAELQKAQEWLDEQGHDTPTKDIENKLSTLKSVSKDVFYKLQEQKDRPKAVEAMKYILNYSSVFLAGMKNLTEDLQIFSEVEINTLEKAINETEKWWKEKEEEQKKKSLHEKPAITLQAVAEKVSSLDREVKYLLNKAKYAKPKAKKPSADSNKTDEKSESENATKSEDGKEEEQIEEETPAEAAAREAEESKSKDTEAEVSEEQYGGDSASSPDTKGDSHEDL